MKYCAFVILLLVAGLAYALDIEEERAYFPIAEVSPQEAESWKLLGGGEHKLYFFLNSEGVIYIETSKDKTIAGWGTYQKLYNIFNHENFREYYASSFRKFAEEKYDIYITDEPNPVIPARRSNNTIYLSQDLVEAAEIAGWQNRNLPSLVLAPIIYGLSKYDGDYESPTPRDRFYEEVISRIYLEIMARRIKADFAAVINELPSYNIAAEGIKRMFQDADFMDITETVLSDYPELKSSDDVQGAVNNIREWVAGHTEAGPAEALLFMVEEKVRAEEQ